MSEMTPTPEERSAINSLKRVAKKWPKSLWLFSANGSLHVMRCGSDGTRVVTKDGGVDPDYSVGTIKIPNDGGEW